MRTSVDLQIDDRNRFSSNNLLFWRERKGFSSTSAQFWPDEFLKAYYLAYRQSEESLLNKQNLINELFVTGLNINVLDIGSSFGLLGLLFEERGAELTHVQLTDDNQKLTERILGMLGSSSKCYHIDKIPAKYLSSQFDLVLLSLNLSSLSPEELQQLISQVSPYLKVGGKALFQSYSHSCFLKAGCPSPKEFAFQIQGALANHLEYYDDAKVVKAFSPNIRLDWSTCSDGEDTSLFKLTKVAAGINESKIESNSNYIYSTKNNSLVPTTKTNVPAIGCIELVSWYKQLENYYLNCELETKLWIVENVETDWTVIDCGANIGYHTILFSKLAPHGEIFAFEPTSTLSMLRDNIEYNKLNNIHLQTEALGQRDGFYSDKIYQVWGNPPQEQEWEFITLDSFYRKIGSRKIDCIKIDVDSFDFEVLRGAETILKECNPWIIIEINDSLRLRNSSPREVFSWLTDRGYQKALCLDGENYVFKKDSKLTLEGHAGKRIEVSYP